MSGNENSTTLPELTQVRLLRRVGETPAGAVGTIVHVYPAGAYEVEFTLGDTFEDHYHTVETCTADDVELANG